MAPKQNVLAIPNAPIASNLEQINSDKKVGVPVCILDDCKLQINILHCALHFVLKTHPGDDIYDLLCFLFRISGFQEKRGYGGAGGCI